MTKHEVQDALCNELALDMFGTSYASLSRREKLNIKSAIAKGWTLPTITG